MRAAVGRIGVLLALAIASASCSSTPSAPSGDGRTTTTSPGPITVPAGTAPVTAADGSNRILLWIGAPECATLTDAQLDSWKANGVGGFVCALQTLSGMTAANDRDKEYEWTGNPQADLSANGYRLQRQLRDSPLVRRVKAGGMKAYLTFYLANRNNIRTPLVEWFDDAGWANLALPKIHDVAGAARLLGFAGIGFDSEVYPGGGRWDWNFPGNTKPEDVTRAAARTRGEQTMKAIVDAFPNVEIFAYGAKFPDTWDATVQAAYKGVPFTVSVQIDFWDGLSSVEGYKALRFTGELFYKRPFPAADWDDALRTAQATMHAYLSQRWSNWRYAAPRFFQAPAAWIDGDGAGAAPSTPANVAEQFKEFRRWTSGDEIYVFAYNALTKFDYAPYVASLRAAAAPGTDRGDAPQLTVSSPPVTSTTPAIELRGTSRDDLAVRSVTVADGQGATYAARMELAAGNGSVSWTAAGIALRPGSNTLTVTAEDIKGLTKVQNLTITSNRP